jgi:hypothetical protein
MGVELPDWRDDAARSARHQRRGAGVRDLAAERAMLAGAVFTGTELERYGLLDGAGRPAEAPVALTALTACGSRRRGWRG